MDPEDDYYFTKEAFEKYSLQPSFEQMLLNKVQELESEKLGTDPAAVAALKNLEVLPKLQSCSKMKKKKTASDEISRMNR